MFVWTSDPVVAVASVWMALIVVVQESVSMDLTAVVYKSVCMDLAMVEFVLVVASSIVTGSGNNGCVVCAGDAAGDGRREPAKGVPWVVEGACGDGCARGEL